MRLSITRRVRVAIVRVSFGERVRRHPKDGTDQIHSTDPLRRTHSAAPDTAAVSAPTIINAHGGDHNHNPTHHTAIATRNAVLRKVSPGCRMGQ